MGSERNNKCWCGSGLKYKKCHLGREQETPDRPIQTFHQKQQVLSKMRYCLHPDAPDNCTKIIKAHTIQRSGRLTSIAEKGHVYQFKANSAFFTKGDLSPCLVGINDATTFTGFCNYHDTLLFKEVENEGIVVTPKTALIFSYRAVCSELFKKQFQLSTLSIDKALDKGMSEFDQIIHQNFMSSFETGLKAGVSNLEFTKLNYESMMRSEDFSKSLYYAVIINKNPEIMCCWAAQMILKDFNNHTIMTHAQATDVSEYYEGVTLTIVDYEVDKGLILFSWVSEQLFILKFIQSLSILNDNEIVHAVLRFLFEYLETSAMSPVWWKSLPDSAKKKVSNRFYTSLIRHGKHNSLLDDGLRIVDWKVISRESNAF